MDEFGVASVRSWVERRCWRVDTVRYTTHCGNGLSDVVQHDHYISFVNNA